ncbi:MAG: hypothetical protein HYS78_01620 [Parcubacteria group bacterium]|nr:hypothetical protein [Parcubacteria group bacterium]
MSKTANRRKLTDLDYKEMKKRLAIFEEQLRRLDAKPPNGNPGKEKRRKHKKDDLRNRLIPQARKFLNLRQRQEEVPFGD